MQRKKSVSKKGARGAEQQPKRVALNKRRQHAAQADRSRPQNKQTTRGLRVCFDARDIQYDARKRARHKRCFSPAVCCRSAGMSRPRQMRPIRLTCEKRQRKSEGRCRGGRGWQGWQGSDPRAGEMGRSGWGCARRRRSAHSRKLGHAPNPGRGRLGLGVLSVQMGIKYVLSLGQRPLLQCRFSYCPCTFSASAVKFSQLSILSVQVWAMNGVLKLSASAALALCVLWFSAFR